LYASKALSADFRDAPAAQRLINDYVREKTQGKLVDLVGDLDAGTAMVLVSYTFFKAKWKTPFDPNDTFQSKFYVGQGRWVTVPMMRSEYLKTPCFRDEALACWVVELGYAGAASALFVLPDKGKMKASRVLITGPSLVPVLSFPGGRAVLGQAQSGAPDPWPPMWLRPECFLLPMELHLPKFSLSSLYHLEGVLPRLGMRKVFSKKADLSGITGDKNLVVSQVSRQRGHQPPRGAGNSQAGQRPGSLPSPHRAALLMTSCPQELGAEAWAGPSLQSHGTEPGVGESLGCNRQRTPPRSSPYCLQSPWLKACPLSFVTGKCGERSCPVPLPGGTGQRQEVVDTALGRLPFLFAILSEDTQSILFCGKVANPTINQGPRLGVSLCLSGICLTPRASGVSVTLMSARIPRASVKFNRPFLFAILSEDTQSILFCGKVANPSAA
ncbi:PREDICTED: alpha-1-antichymotrypsin, partial [Myotis brandtii]|uniref:alpha-1-antichymotrypsin n=1 Tax=Myotis brandtii TaxID=109478 RepID=UPI000703F439